MATRFHDFFGMFILAGAAVALWAAPLRGDEVESAAAGAQAYRANAPVAAQPDGSILAEAEEFHITGQGGWQAKNWGENYYASTFANTFLSRKAFLGAPAKADKSEAKIVVNVPAAGRYLALVRYEAAYRFETQFKLRVEQQGQVKLDRLYGARDNVKIWAFKGGGKSALQKEVGWSWGAVENIVWEGHDTFVDLQSGPATLTLIATQQPEPAAKRNIDLVLLTTNVADVNRRIGAEGYLPLDGLLTQAGDVFFKVTNLGPAELTLSVPPCIQHSPYWVHLRDWKAVKIKVAPGQSSDWQDVGGLLDSLNDGDWKLSAATTNGHPLDYKVEVGLKTAAGAVTPIASFKSTQANLQLAYDADTRYTHRIRTIDQILYDLSDYLKRHPVPGEPPKRTIVYGETFNPIPGDARYNVALAEFVKSFSLSQSVTPSGAPAGYLEVRHIPTGKLEEHFKSLKMDPRSVRTVSMGDEIGMPAPSANSHDDFRAWAKSRGLTPAQIDPQAGEDWSKILYAPQAGTKSGNPRLYYYSRLYAQAVGVAALKQRSDIVKRILPNADAGANFSPHGEAAYLGEANQWITLFRQGGMTMPWGEDYIWQVPVGSPEMTFLCLDLFRAGLRYRKESAIQFYVMPHTPGNTPAMWRRQFYGDLGHGMKIVNLFEFRPVQVAYTENHASLPEMYLQVKRSLHELTRFEDIIQEGKVRQGNAGLWYSQAGEAWDNHTPPLGTGKRTLAVAARHQQLQLEVLDEEDALKGTLNAKDFKVLYLTDPNVSRPASKAIAAWVKSGGHLLATAGAGMKDEFNQPNEIMEELLGVKQTALEVDPKILIVYEKQDLPFAEAMDTVTVRTSELNPWAVASLDPAAAEAKIPVLGCRSKVTLHGAKVLGTFRDKSPALTVNKVGGGVATYAGFLPGLSYFKPALPMQPADRGSTDDAMAHFIPTAFDPAAAAVIASNQATLERPVLCSNPLVEATIVESKHGLAIPLTNWSKGPVKGLTVTLSIPVPSGKVELAGGGNVKVEKKGNQTILTLDLDVADALILR